MRAAPEQRTVVYAACPAPAVVSCASARGRGRGTMSARLNIGPPQALELSGQDPRPVAESWLRAQGLPAMGKALH